MARGTWGGSLEVHPLRVVISMTRGIDKFQTGFHLRNDPAGNGNAQDAANDVATFVQTNFRTLLTNDVTVAGIDVVDVVDLSGGSVSPSGEIGTKGIAGAVEGMPLFTMVPVSFKSEIRARYGQGRGFWPVLPKEWTSEEKLVGNGVAAFQAVIDAMAARYIGSITPSNFHLINFHGLIPERPATTTRPLRPAIPPSWYDVQSIRLNTNLSALHSRRSGVGS